MNEDIMWIPRIDKTDKPKYIAIADALETDIKCGNLLPGQQLPPQRELADRIRLNVSTISRAYREGERRGLIGGTVGRGTFVAADATITREMMRSGGVRQNVIEMGIVVPLYHQPDGKICSIAEKRRSLTLPALHRPLWNARASANRC